MSGYPVIGHLGMVADCGNTLHMRYGMGDDFLKYVLIDDDFGRMVYAPEYSSQHAAYMERCIQALFAHLRSLRIPRKLAKAKARIAQRSAE